MRKALIAFLGGGNMTRALIAGLIGDDYPPSHICVADRHPEKLAQMAAEYQVETTEHIEDAISGADIVVLAVKPQGLAALAGEISAKIKKDCPLIISVMAGIKTQDLEHYFGSKAPIVRTMPNTASLLRSGATGLFANANVSSEQKSTVEHMMRSVGITVWVSEESLIDVIAAIAGSGPAYFFFFMEQIEKAATNMGLDAKTAKLLTMQTAFGASKMAMESGDSFATLKDQVTSKGGMTQAALEIFESMEVEKVIKDALQAAKDRGVELSQLFGANPTLADTSKT